MPGSCEVDSEAGHVDDGFPLEIGSSLHLVWDGRVVVVVGTPWRTWAYLQGRP